MKVELTQIDGMKFEATTARSVKFAIDPQAISPQEYFALGAIACSATDIVMLPEKQGKTVSRVAIGGDFTRTETAPFYFNEIHISYSFDSNGSDLDARRWVLSSLESYCTTLNTLRGTAKIYYSITHNGEPIADRESILSGSSDTRGVAAADLGNNACPA
ncbi:hypothetical protein AGMMS50229_04750 [Campylobacterota bacterium]|nr:hypothetical protein AGMMS50229_04750 [Campylobacterota bacterium]